MTVAAFGFTGPWAGVESMSSDMMVEIRVGRCDMKQRERP